VSTIAREVKRNSTTGEYRPHAAQALMLARMPRPKPRLLETDSALRALVQHCLDQRWSPEQIVQELQRRHGRQIAVETVYQALYSPKRIVHREPSAVLRLGRPYRRPRRRGDQRRPRFVVPIRLVDERPIEARDRLVPGHWAGDLIVGAFNRSAIGTLVERTTRYTVLVHLGDGSRAEALRDGLGLVFSQLPETLRRSLTWDQGSEMCHHHAIAASTGMPVYFCKAGCPWQRRRMRTPTACCATTSRRAAISRSTARRTWLE
jgi:IS30 family transposase